MQQFNAAPAVVGAAGKADRGCATGCAIWARPQIERATGQVEASLQQSSSTVPGPPAAPAARQPASVGQAAWPVEQQCHSPAFRHGGQRLLQPGKIAGDDFAASENCYQFRFAGVDAKLHCRSRYRPTGSAHEEQCRQKCAISPHGSLTSH